ncbi:MAG: nuclease, partial [Pseudomonadota bacterium]|nr:nuclease [Pseudomonadota bacterium]
MNDEERLERVRGKLTPELRQLISEKAAAGELPEPIASAIREPTLEKVARDAEPLESIGGENIAALEAIVQRYGRPPLLIRNGHVELETLVKPFPGDIDTKIVAAERWIPSVGRVE